MKTSTTTDTDTDTGGRPLPLSVPTLTVVHHPDPSREGARCALGPRPLELGRGSTAFGADALDHARTSRRHARVTVEGETLLVEDLDSRNGTTLNGERVTRGRAVFGDVLEIGAVLLLFHRAPAAFSLRKSAAIVGQSAAIARVLDEVDAVARHATTVLVLGETGTGKELVAREIHERSGRAGELIATNCGSLTATLLQSELFGHERGAFSGAATAHRGLFEAAHQGTLLLDEIGDASPELQVALLRVLQEKEIRRLGSTRAVAIDTRVVAATHRDLAALVAAGRFREDLYARLAHWVIDVPPLRARPEDVPHLAREVLRRLGEPRRLHRSAVLALVRGRYPRNVRQLEAVLVRVVRQSRPSEPELRMTEEALAWLGDGAGATSAARESEPAGRPSTSPPSVPPGRGDPTLKDDPARLRALLERHAGNVTHAAAEIGVGRNTLYRWLRDAGVSLERARSDD